MTGAERRAALEAVASEVRACTRCRLHLGRTLAVPGEGNPDTEVVFVGEGPGFNEDRQGRPFVGRAGDLLVDLLGSIGWRREDVFITNIVKCRPPENRDPQPEEVAACSPFLFRQLAALDPALVVTLGRHSMGRFLPGTTITRAHGTLAPVDPATGAPAAMAYAMYHPAAALRTPAIEQATRADMAGIPAALMTARAHREPEVPGGAEAAPGDESWAADPSADVDTVEARGPADDHAPADGHAPADEAPANETQRPVDVAATDLPPSAPEAGPAVDAAVDQLTLF